MALRADHLVRPIRTSRRACSPPTSGPPPRPGLAARRRDLGRDTANRHAAVDRRSGPPCRAVLVRRTRCRSPLQPRCSPKSASTPTSKRRTPRRSTTTARASMSGGRCRHAAYALPSWAARIDDFWDCILDHRCASRLRPAASSTGGRPFSREASAIASSDARDLIRNARLSTSAARRVLRTRSASTNGRATPEPGRSSFRWPQVQRMLTDIRRRPQRARIRRRTCCRLTTAPCSSTCWRRRTPGFRLERAVATTFTLHLTALLPVPLGLAGADLQLFDRPAQHPSGDPQLLRPHRHLLPGRARVAVPSQRNDLLAFLEPMVHQVKAPAPVTCSTPSSGCCGSSTTTGASGFASSAAPATSPMTGRGMSSSAWRAAAPFSRACCQPADRRPPRVPGRARPGRRARQTARGRDQRARSRPSATSSGNAPTTSSPSKDWLDFHVFGPGRAGRARTWTGYRRLVVSPFLNDAGLDHVWPDGAGECVLLSRGEELNALGDRVARLARQTTPTFESSTRTPPSPIPIRTRPGCAGRFPVFTPSSTSSSATGRRTSSSARRTQPMRPGAATMSCSSRSSAESAPTAFEATLGAVGASGFGRILLPHTLGDAVEETAEEELRRTFENALRDLSSLTYTATVEGEHETPLLWVRSDEPLRRGVRASTRTPNSPSNS